MARIKPTEEKHSVYYYEIKGQTNSPPGQLFLQVANTGRAPLTLAGGGLLVVICVGGKVVVVGVICVGGKMLVAGCRFWSAVVWSLIHC